MIKKINDPNLKIGDTVKFEVPPRFILADQPKIIDGEYTIIEINEENIVMEINNKKLISAS